MLKQADVGRAVEVLEIEKVNKRLLKIASSLKKKIFTPS